MAFYSNNALFKYIHECYIYIHDIFEKKDCVGSLMNDFMVLTRAPGVQRIRKSERFRFARNHGNRKHKARENNREYGRTRRDLARASSFLDPYYWLIIVSRVHLPYSAAWQTPLSQFILKRNSCLTRI